LIVPVGQRLMSGKPQSLRQEKKQEPRRNALRKIELEAANPGKPRRHHDQGSQIQFKRLDLKVF
jgi:hypothetical protein